MFLSRIHAYRNIQVDWSSSCGVFRNWSLETSFLYSDSLIIILSNLKSNLFLGVEIELVLGVFMLMCCGSEYPRGSQAWLWRFHIIWYQSFGSRSGFIVYRLRSLNLNSCVFLFFSNSFFFFFVPCSLSLFVDLVLVSLIQSVVLQFVVEVIKKKFEFKKKNSKFRSKSEEENLNY